MKRQNGRAAPFLYFFLCLFILGFLYKFLYRGTVGGDGHYYYSTTVSLLWDKDLDLKNQFDHKLPYRPGTVADGIYSVDQKTGRAFALFNPGTGFFMLPTAFLARQFLNIKHGTDPDPFDPRIQFYAHFASVAVTALALLLLFLILKQFYSPAVSFVVPLLFLFGTNWIFYAIVLPNWSHAYSLFCNVALLWSFLLLIRKNNAAAAAFFGLIGGIGYTTKNFNVILLVLFGLAFWLLRPEKEDSSPKARSTRPKKFLLLGVAALAALAGALPQFAVKMVQHGSVFTSSFAAELEASQKSVSLQDIRWVEGLVPSNLDMLYSNLLNNENGLFYHHPLFLLGLAGAVLLRHNNRRFRNIQNLLLAGLAVFWFIDAAYWDNWFSRAAGAGFGHRRYIDILPVFIFGTANLFERVRAKKLARYALIVLASLLAAAAVSFLYHFLADYPAVSLHRDSFFEFQGFLLSGALPWAVFAAVSGIMILVFRMNGLTFGTSFRKPAAFVLMFAGMALSAVIFGNDPSVLRKRHLARDGFFLMYTSTPLVQLKGKEWALPEDLSRRIFSSHAQIKLPAPLCVGDRILFKIQAPGGPPREMEILAGGESIGREPLRDGLHIYSFPVALSPKQPRIMRIRISGPNTPPPHVLFHEGRIIYQGQNRNIRQDIYWLKIIDEEIVLKGWCLDDHQIQFIGLYASAGENATAVFLGQPRRNPQTLTEHPDLNIAFVLYPELERAAYEIRLPIPDEFKGKTVRFWVEVASEDGDRAKSRVVSETFPEMSSSPLKTESNGKLK